VAVRIAGVIVFEEEPRVPAGTLHVQVEDVTYVDRAARVVASSRAPLAGGAAPAESAFALELPALDAGARYTLRVLVDLDGDGAIGPGDFVSTQAHPVRGGELLRVRVRRV
jgi:hypothetical protein